MGFTSLSHWLILIIILLLLFGPYRLSTVVKSLGQTVKNFKNALRDQEVSYKKIETDSDEGKS